MAPSACGWSPDLTLCRSGACCPDVDDPGNAVVAQIALDLAVDILFRLTGSRFSQCEVTVRPCKPLTCDPLTLNQKIFFWDRYAWNNGNLGVFGFSPTLIDGQVYNIACGCPTGCCKCRSDCEAWLPGPVGSITSVISGGITLDPDTYKLMRTAQGDKLVFLVDEDGNSQCPPCQDYNKPAGEVGTWTVTYTIGEAVPDVLNVAAGLYACELAKSLLGEACGLPSRVKSVTRQGVDVEFVDPMILAENGLTGLPIVDQIVISLNPNKLTQRSYTWSPATPRVRRGA